MYKFFYRSLHEGNMSFGHIATFSLPCDNLKTQPQLCFYQKKIFTIIVIDIDIDIDILPSLLLIVYIKSARKCKTPLLTIYRFCCKSFSSLFVLPTRDCCENPLYCS